MKNKIVLLTGATGGIGSEIAKQLLLLGCTIYAPIRNIEKAKRIFGENSQIKFSLINIEKLEPTSQYILDLQNHGIVFDLVILAAGDFWWDDDERLIGATPEEKQEDAIKKMNIINYVTSETIILGLLDAYQNLSMTTLVIISSQAANFEIGHPKRVNEEGYVLSKQKLSALGKRLLESKKLKDVFVEEPALVGTQKAKDRFNQKTIGQEPDWENQEKKPEEYALELLKKLGLI